MNDRWLAYCLDQALGPKKLSNKDLRDLKNFYMVQQALSQELLAAKPLGICKTSISKNPIGEIPSRRRNSREIL